MVSSLRIPLSVQRRYLVATIHHLINTLISAKMNIFVFYIISLTFKTDLFLTKSTPPLKIAVYSSGQRNVQKQGEI